jgi:hypothetical protein
MQLIQNRRFNRMQGRGKRPSRRRQGLLCGAMLVAMSSRPAWSLYWSDEWDNKSYAEQVSRLLEVTVYLAQFDCEMPESVRWRAAGVTLDRDMFLRSQEGTARTVRELADPRLADVSRVLGEMVVALGKENAKKGRRGYPGGDPRRKPIDTMKSPRLWQELRKPTALNLDPLIEATRTLSKLATGI